MNFKTDNEIKEKNSLFKKSNNTFNFYSTKNNSVEYDVVCFSHLRWDFVYQRPQHIMSRFAKNSRVFFIEEPIFDDGPAQIDVTERTENLYVCVPHLPRSADIDFNAELLPYLIRLLLEERGSRNYITWFYTPMMINWAKDLSPIATVYDCMDELSAFKNAASDLTTREHLLFALSDLVFTGGRSLYEAKRLQHKSVYEFPSSIDVKHFAQALTIEQEVEDQAAINRPRIGFAGVIDERMDIELLGAIADLRPEWNFVMVGPIVKIDENDLPKRPNIFYLGGKKYDDLPVYMAGWDAAILPFALNDSTKFISPTKTPEYLAAGLPVVSTPITDVIRPYGDRGLVSIAATPAEFVEALEKEMNYDKGKRHAETSDFLSRSSWDKTFQSMSELIENVIQKRETLQASAGVTAN